MKPLSAILVLLCVLVAASCLSGSKKVLSRDVSGLREIEFPLRVGKSYGHESKTVSIEISGVDRPCRMFIENKGKAEHRVSWTKDEGGRHGGDHQLKPGDKKEIYDGASSGLGFGLYDLTGEKTDMLVTIIFEEQLPDETHMHVGLLWADGP